MKLGLSTHKGTAKDSTGCEFAYTCQSDKYYMGGELHTERHYTVYDGKDTGKNNIMAEADSLKDLKVKMGRI